jgi:hypothetical protein
LNKNRIIQNQRNIKGLSYARLTQENVNTLNISCIICFSVAQFIPLQTTEMSVEPDKEYQVENILKNG